MYYKYTQEDIDALCLKDPILCSYIHKVGFLKRPLTKDLFESFVNAIISQQISIKAAKTIEQRLKVMIKNITPENIYALDIDEIQSIGITFRKAHYIKSIAYHFIENDYSLLFDKSDEEILDTFIKFEGIRRWTIEMLLLHTFERPDILSYQDIAIRRGMERMYGIEVLDRKTFNKIKSNLSPYGSIASIYFWHISKGDQNEKL